MKGENLAEGEKLGKYKINAIYIFNADVIHIMCTCHSHDMHMCHALRTIIITP